MLTNEDNENFRAIVDSLKKSRKEPILDERTGEVVNHLLYEDPFRDDHQIKDAKRPRTAFIEGRRGTGKSTLLQKLQAELRKDRRVVALYIDAKRVVIDAGLQNQALNDTADGQFARKIALFGAFMPLFIRELKKELVRKKQKGPSTAKSLQAGFDALADISRFISEIDISSGARPTFGTVTQTSHQTSVNGGITLGPTDTHIGIGGGAQKSS